MTADSRLWAKIDLGYLSNPKMADILDASCNAVCMHLASILHSAQHLTDGEVSPKAMMRAAGGTQEDADLLIEAGLWHEPGHDCETCPQPREHRVYVHDYLRHNVSSTTIEKASERGRKAAEARWNKRKNAPRMQDACEPHADRNAKRNARSDQIDQMLKELPKGSSKKQAATRIPDGWEPTPRVRDDLTQKHPSVDIFYEYQKFCDYWRAESGAKARKHDWDATFRNWVRRADENQKNRPQQFLTAAEKRAQQSMAHIQAMSNYQPTNPFEQKALTIDPARNRQLGGTNQSA